MPQTFSLLPVFRPVLSKGASKVKIAWHLVAINFGYEYLCFVIYFSEIFFPKMFFSNFFLFQFFPQNYFFEIFSQNFFFQIFFFKFVPHNFFSNFFQKLFFLGLYSGCLPVYRDKTDSMYLCYEKSRVAGAIRDKYITYRTDTGRSAVYVFVFVFFFY